MFPAVQKAHVHVAQYAFASFLARDTVYDVIDNIRKLERPDPDAPPTGMRRPTLSTIASSDSILALGEGHDLILTSGAPPPVGTPGTGATVQAHKPTQCACGRDGKHYTETALESVLPGTPERIYNLMFASAFIKEFMAVDQKLMGKQASA